MNDKEIDLEKMRTIGVLGYPYGKPKYCPTEGEYFNSVKEYDQYAKVNKLVPVEGPTTRPIKQVYIYDAKGKKMVEVVR
jgi:hypothetical protein